MRILRLEDRPAMPWKNGGGETVEIAVFPEGVGFQDFGWRISLASVASNGPFSTFPGIDRTLTVIDGAGIELVVDGVAHRLVPGSPPLSFPGDVPAAGRLVDGPIRDLNVMTRRGVFAHRVERVDGAAVAAAPGEVTAVAALGICRVADTALAAGDTVFLDVGERVTVSGVALIVRIAAVDG